MELEQLKSIWKKTTGEQGEGYFISREEVQTLIEKRSTLTVSEIKRSVRNKVFMAGGIGLFMVLFSFYTFSSEEAVLSFFESASNTHIGIFYLVFGLVICFISAYNAVSYRRISHIEEHEHDVKTSIKNILSILKKAVTVKIYSDVAVIPLTVLTFAIVELVRGNGLFPGIQSILITVSAALAYAVFAYFLTKRGQEKRYGRQIKTLEDCLQELEE